ncbi:DUF2865 domain-containing protein [Bosea sp. OAE506]|uniref:DUF2865 domain-containing protein n=1 Tax=Bosea sp. OAE506 TaxID=2663870 RepID=UPI001789E761
MLFRRLRLRSPGRLGAALFALALTGGAAVAQSPACNAWRSELASLQGQRGGGDPRAAQMAQRVGAQLAQATNQYRAMGCERGGFTFFGEGPPRECGGLRAQIGQLQAQYANLQQAAQGGAVEQRRAQLASAINANCRAPQQRGFFETIFGLEPRRGEIDSTMPELDPEQPIEPEKPRMGGPQTVCVRTCDGFFFPLANNPGGRDSSDEMCQALCPGVETLAYGMTNGGDIQNAVARATGQPYASLPNAGKYQRSFDSACTCRAQGQSWAQALKEAEYLLDKRKGDVIVTEQRAAELSRPKEAKPDPKRRGAAAPAVQPAATPAIPEEKPMPSENSPTSGTESAGVGPASVGERVLDKGDGLKRESQSVTGERRTVRIVAPNLAPNLGNATIRP